MLLGLLAAVAVVAVATWIGAALGNAWVGAGVGVLLVLLVLWAESSP